MMNMAVASFGLTNLSLIPPTSASTSYPFQRSTQERRVFCGALKTRFGSSKGVLERPAFDQSQFDPFTQVLEGGDIGQLKDKKGIGNGDSYRVVLIDDFRHSDKLVAKVLPQVVRSITPDDARRLFHESRESGSAVVIVAVKEHAEFYAQMMVRGGLRSSIEPDSTSL
ncbi:uncharacterized protein LOC116123055 [Pistacia vera]|uniref:uncharacterized protein LOC116123055 n=1 Tax=Pistacia vera TaxID=55513 RepID=UPI0012636CFD|nr:uncharacterized protein LOC116123055 [Pistacia vera]